ncbi:IS256 family transposase, partial [Paenarthrobacter ureafaciens]|nr:IS256 family transposase [Paenarthrobacter ureafaciens]
VDWYLYLHTELPQDPWQLVRPHHWQPRRRNPTLTDDPTGPALHDTAFSSEDGNGIQKGWGGRHR